MESLKIGARVGVQVGEPLDGNHKSWLNLELNYGTSVALALEEEMKKLLKGADPEVSLVVILHANPGQKKELAEGVEKILKNKYKSKEMAPLLGAILMGVIGYKVLTLDDDTSVVVQLKPGLMSKKKVEEVVDQATGMLKLADTEEGSLKISLLTGTDFYEVVQDHDAGFKTLSTLMKAFKGELVVSSKYGFNVLQKVFEIIESLNPSVSVSPLFQLLDLGELDFTFRGLEDVPEDLRKSIGEHEQLGRFPRRPFNPTDTAAYDALNSIVDFVAPNFEIYSVLKGVMGIKVDGNFPGLGTGSRLTE